jgi:alkanesulfonate monooxygenase SsuD/methylene tetrahydromethanopterin reductase-like flavin-dependent oxidoreductase (luciferase family)
MVQFLRRALRGERVVFPRATFSVDGFRLTRPPSHPIPIHVAALRPGMLKVAGETADGAVLNWLSPGDVPKSVRVVRDAARQAGRDPLTIEITARLIINVDPPTPQSDQVVRRHIAGYLNVPVYRAFHEWLGRTPDHAMWAPGAAAWQGRGRSHPESATTYVRATGGPEWNEDRARLGGHRYRWRPPPSRTETAPAHGVADYRSTRWRRAPRDQGGIMEGMKDSSHLYEVERRARHAERLGFASRASRSPTQRSPAYHSIRTRSRPAGTDPALPP